MVKTTFGDFLYINFELDPSIHHIFDQDLDPKRILREFEKIGHKIDIGQTLLIFDEIQTCPRALTSLKYFFEQLPDLHICAAGSLLGLQLPEGSFPVGKVDLLNIFPMTFEEFLNGIGEEQLYDVLVASKKSGVWPKVLHSRLFDRFKDYLIVGGMPEVVADFARHQEHLQDAYERARSLQEKLITQYLADIAKHSGKVNSMHIERVWSNAATQLASTHDGTSDKFKFKDVVPNVRGYERLARAIEWLIKSGLILKIPICKKANSPLKAFTEESTFKLYVFDVGILGAMVRLRPSSIVAYEFGSYKGYLAENFVAQELISTGFRLTCWREGTSEVDFLIENDMGVVPIEVKSGQSTKAKSLSVFQKKYSPKLAIKISGLYPDTNRNPNELSLPLYGLNALGAIIKATAIRHV